MTEEIKTIKAQATIGEFPRSGYVVAGETFYNETYVQRLKQENAAYKSSIIANLDRNISKRYAELLDENEKLKEEFKKTSDGLLKIQYKLANNCNTYRKALEEIRDNLKNICDRECDFHWCKGSCPDSDCDYYTNINKINEVLNDSHTN